MSDFLESMAASSAERASSAGPIATADCERPVVPLPVEPFGVIAEIKNRSPAEGELAKPDSNRAARARQYAAAGAAAISVLTEPTRFGGSLAHLEEVVAAVPGTPVMRKDFLVDPAQIDEARAAGASGVLLIVAMLDDARLRLMLDRTHALGLFVLVESFDARDLERLGRLLSADDRERIAEGQFLVGVNSRNLRTLAVDGQRLETLAPRLPSGRAVAESGLETPGDAARVASLGYTMALVGTALMRADDPGKLVADMRDAGSRVLTR